MSRTTVYILLMIENGFLGRFAIKQNNKSSFNIYVAYNNVLMPSHSHVIQNIFKFYWTGAKKNANNLWWPLESWKIAKILNCLVTARVIFSSTALFIIKEGIRSFFVVVVADLCNIEVFIYSFFIAGRPYTVSIALPGSILDNAQSPELRTYLAGQVFKIIWYFNS